MSANRRAGRCPDCWKHTRVCKNCGRLMIGGAVKVGKLARYTSKFLQYTGQFLDVPINGIVLSIDDPRGDGSAIARIVWCSDTDRAVSVLVSNLELDPACRADSYPDLVREFTDRGIS